MLPPLLYPNRSHRKEIVFPLDSEYLAELFGIIAGDGGMSNWQLTISLNSLVDAEYSNYVADLLKRLFGIQAPIRKRPNQNTLIIQCSSRDLVDFLEIKGYKVGNKISNNLNMPEWISNNDHYTKKFLRGLFDTDGCVYIDRHVRGVKVYRNICIAFRNYSLPLLDSVSKALRNFGYHPTLTTKNCVNLRREKEVLKFFREIGSSNLRNLNRYHYFLEEYRSGHNGTVSKAVVQETEPWVRIPPPPPKASI